MSQVQIVLQVVRLYLRALALLEEQTQHRVNLVRRVPLALADQAVVQLLLHRAVDLMVAVHVQLPLVMLAVPVQQEQVDLLLQNLIVQVLQIVQGITDHPAPALPEVQALLLALLHPVEVREEQDKINWIECVLKIKNRAFKALFSYLSI